MNKFTDSYVSTDQLTFFLTTDPNKDRISCEIGFLIDFSNFLSTVSSSLSSAVLEIKGGAVIVTIQDIARESGVSKATVSRVLNENARVGKAIREKVLAVMRHHDYQPNRVAQSLRNGMGLYGPRFYEKAHVHQGRKAAIARKAREYVKDGMTIFLDAGTTTMALAKLLPTVSGITVVTSSCAAHAELLDSGLTIVLAGGQYVPDIAGTTGPLTEQAYSSFQADVAFISGSSLCRDHGLGCYNEASYRIKDAMIQHSHRAIVLIDSSKGDGPCLRNAISLDRFSVLITDGNLSDEWLTELADKLTLIVAPEESESPTVEGL